MNFQPACPPMLWTAITLLPLDMTKKVTDYEFLSYICSEMNKLIESNNNLNNGVKLNSNQIAQLQSEVAEIEKELQKVKNGDYVSLYLDSIINYIDNNLKCLVQSIVTYVMFGLSKDGYFTAYIPETWQFLKFDTVVDSTNPLFGHLILQW